VFRAKSNFPAVTASAELTDAQRWLKASGGGTDGVMAKRLDLPYQAGNREGMQKIKMHRTADCVVGGFRYGERPQSAGKRLVGSLLLGLYDDEGLLHHVGFTSGIKTAEKRELTDKLEKIRAERSFTGNAPGAPSRWSTKRSSEWMGPGTSEVCRGSLVRPFFRGPFSARHDDRSLAAGQKADAMHDGTAQDTQQRLPALANQSSPGGCGYFHPFFFGTRFPFFRAFESPIAIGCLRLLTFPPRPLFAVPRL
jgi:hypothetical protein